MSNIITDASGTLSSIDANVAAYWNGLVSRSEIQPIFEEYAAVIARQAETILKLDAAVQFLFEKFAVTADDFKAWFAAKAAAATAEPQPEAPKTSLIVEG